MKDKDFFEFETQCRRHGYNEIGDFENKVLRPLLTHFEIFIVGPSKPHWLINALKKYYDIDVDVYNKFGSNVYSFSISKNNNYVDYIDNETISNYFE